MGAACFFYHGEDDVSTPERPIPVPKWLADQAKQEGIDVIEDGVALKPRSETLAHSCLPASARAETHSAVSSGFRCIRSPRSRRSLRGALTRSAQYRLPTLRLVH